MKRGRKKLNPCRSVRSTRVFSSGIIPVKSPLRHRVAATPSPRMTAQKPPHREVEPFERSVFSESLERILGAGRGKTACPRQERRNSQLVEPDQGHERRSGYRPPASRSATSAASGVVAVPVVFAFRSTHSLFKIERIARSTVRKSAGSPLAM